VGPADTSRGAANGHDAPALTLGVDIGGTKTAVALTRGGEVVEHTVALTPVDDLGALIQSIDTLVRPFLARFEVASVGVCAPGLVDPSTGLIGHCANVPALIDAPLEAQLCDRLGLPVRVENDANAAAWAEHRFGAARAWRASFFLTVSTGVGGGFVSEHGLHRGRHGYAADVGHITLVQDGRRCSCGERGCVETYSSGKAVAERASEAYGRSLTTREAFALARAGDPVAAAIVADAARALATALVTVTKVVDPDGLVIGGGVASNEPWFVDQVRAHLAASLLTYRPVPLEVAQLGARAGVIGAANLSR
jgi:glucokinase